MAEKLNRLSQLQPVLDTALELTLQLLGLEAGWISLLDEEGRFYSAAAHGLPPALEAGDRAALRWSPCRCQKMLLAGELTAAANILRCERLEEIWRALEGATPEVTTRQTGGLRYHASVPLRVGDRLLGVMTLARTEEKPVAEEELLLLTLTAETISIAIERAQLYEKVRAVHLRQQEVLLRFSRKLLGLAETGAVISAVADAAQEALHVDYVALMLPDSQRRWLVLAGGAGWEPEAYGRYRVPAGTSVEGRAFQTGEIIYQPDMGRDVQLLHAELLRARGVVSGIVVPLRSDVNILGVLAAYTTRQRHFQDDEVRLLTVIANQGAVALEKAWLLEETRRQARQQAALFRLSLSLGAVLDEEEVCRKTVREVTEGLEYDYAEVLLVDEESGAVVSRARAGESPVSDESRPAGQGLPAFPFPSEQFQYTPDLAQDPRYGPDRGRGAEVTAPLRVGDRVAGMLVVRSREPHAFKEEDFALLTAVANLVGIVLERAREHQAVLRAEARYRELFESVPVGLYRSTPEGELLDANAALVALLGYPDQESLLAIDIPSQLYVDPADRRRWQALMAREGVVRGYEYRLRRYDGSVIWVRDTARTVRDESGRVLYYEGSLEDITAEKAAAEERKRSLARIQRQHATLVRLATHPALAEGRLGVALPYIAEAVADTLAVERVSIWRLSADGRELHCLAAFGRTGREHTAGEVLLRERYPRYFASLEAGRVVDAVNVRTDTRTAELNADYWEPLEIFSTLDTPVRLRGRVVGVVCHEEVGKTRVWAPDEVTFAGQVADLVALTFLQAENQRRLQEVTLLSRIITLTATARGLRPALERICAELARFFAVPQVAFALLNSERTAAEVIAEYREPGRPSGVGVTIPVQGNPSMAYILQHRRPLAIADAQHDPRLAPVHEVMRQRGTVSLLLVPITTGGEVIGTLGIDAIERREFTPDEITLAHRAAEQAGQVLERLRLLEAAREHADRMTKLARVSEALNRPLSVSEVVAAIGEGAMELNKAEQAAVYLRHKDGTVTCPWSHGLSAAHVAREARYVQELLASGLAESPQPMLIPDVEQLPAESPVRELAAAAGYRAPGLWPLVYEQRVIAVIGCYYDEPHTWHVAEQEAMQALARQAAIALENARLHEELVAANAELVEALRVREEMLQNVSHELRTPLTLILGYAELLAEEIVAALPEEAHRAVSVIVRQGRHLTQLVDRLLMFRRLQGQEISTQPVFIASWLDEVATAWKPVLASAGLRLELDVSADVGEVQGNPDYLQEVIHNLLDNARKFSPKGGKVTLRAWREGDEVYISVSDEGIGVAPEKLSRLFERFYQVEGGTARHFSGMGLGLALCKEVVERHGGRIWAESEGEGKGLTVTLVLPTPGT